MSNERAERKIKCVVWDLDDTLWEGTLLEDGEVKLRRDVLAAIRDLDRRGVLHSLASRNDPERALGELRKHGIEDLFLYPQIHWGSKSKSLELISNELNLSLDQFAFVDDQAYEREEVAFAHPQVLCLDAGDAAGLPARPEFMPHRLSDESAQRRVMYRQESLRKRELESFVGSNEEFLAGLEMRFEIRRAREDDLARAEELTQRTHQLNSTGITFSYDELKDLLEAPDHVLLVTSLRDRFGPYGTVGLALVEIGEEAWTVKLLLMSCRVLSRGVGAVLLRHLMRCASAADTRLRVWLAPTTSNRLMSVTLRLSGFGLVEEQQGRSILEQPLADVPDDPAYLTVVAERWAPQR